MNSEPKARVLKQYELWDIPNTMLLSFKQILQKYPNKPMIIIVWEYENEP